MNLISELVSGSIAEFITAHICDGFCPEAVQRECSYKTLDKKLLCINATINKWEGEDGTN